MHNLRHDNRADVGILSAIVECVPAEKHTLFASALLVRDLMRGPWWLRAMTSIVGRLRGWTQMTTWYLFLGRIGQGFASDIVVNFSSHIMTGKDQSDLRSVGGLNQQEIDTTIMLLRNLLIGVDIDPLYRSILNPSPQTKATTP